MKVAIYARVSTDDKEQNPERQVHACRNYCELHNHQITTIVQEHITGNSNPLERPEFKKCFTEQIEGIVIYEISRFSREHPSKVMQRLQHFKDRGVKIISITEPAFNMEGDFSELLQYIMTWFNNYYLTNLSRNVKSGLEKAIKDGKTLGRPKAKFNQYRAYYLLFEKKMSLDQVAKEVGTSKGSINRFKKVAIENPSLFIKEEESPKTGDFETEEQ